jgi:predicted RNA binding protein YcfA (HicA-like mRNA interferase family)
LSPRLPRVTAAALLRALQRGGWTVKRQTGGHIHLVYPGRPGLVTLPQHAGETLKELVVASVLKQAGLTAEELRELL